MWSRRNFAPTLFISVNGETADDLLRFCISFNHKRAKSKAAETKIVFRNDDRKLCDDPRLFPNVRWKFRYGFLNDMSVIHTGIVRNIEPVYDMKRIVTVTLYDDSLNMSLKSSGRNWGLLPSSDVAKKIAAMYGMSAVVDASNDKPKKAWIHPISVNDIQFLRDIAANIDFEVWVAGAPPTLFYKRKAYDRAPKFSFTYYDDPTEFSYVKKFAPKVKGLGPIKAGVVGTNSKTGDADKASTKQGEKSAQALADYNAVFSWNGDNPPDVDVVAEEEKNEDVSKPAPDGANVGALSQASRQQQLDKTNEAESEHPLTASISPGDIIEWKGIEKQLSGKWYVEEVEDEITGRASGTKIKWKRNAKGQGSTDAKNKNKKDTEGDDSSAPQVVIDNATGGAEVVNDGDLLGSD